MPFFSRRRRDKAAAPSQEISSSSSPSSPVPPVSVPSTSVSASASSVAHHKDKTRPGKRSLFSTKRTSSRLSSCDCPGEREDHFGKKEANDTKVETTSHKPAKEEPSSSLQSSSSSPRSRGRSKAFSPLHQPSHSSATIARDANTNTGGGGGEEAVEGDLPSREKTAFSYPRSDKNGEKPDSSSSSSNRPGARRSFSRHFSWKLPRSFSSCRSSSSCAAAGARSSSSSSSSSSASRGSLFKNKGRAHQSGRKSFSKKSKSPSSFSSSARLHSHPGAMSSSHNESGGGTGGGSWPK